MRRISDDQKASCGSVHELTRFKLNSLSRITASLPTRDRQPLTFNGRHVSGDSQVKACLRGYTALLHQQSVPENGDLTGLPASLRPCYNTKLCWAPTGEPQETDRRPTGQHCAAKSAGGELNVAYAMFTVRFASLPSGLDCLCNCHSNIKMWLMEVILLMPQTTWFKVRYIWIYFYICLYNNIWYLKINK